MKITTNDLIDTIVCDVPNKNCSTSIGYALLSCTHKELCAPYSVHVSDGSPYQNSAGHILYLGTLIMSMGEKHQDFMDMLRQRQTSEER